jgi:hypothetical protein
MSKTDSVQYNIALQKSDYISLTTAAPTSLKSKLNKSRIQPSPLPEGLAGTAWEPSKLPNSVSITPPLQHGSVSHYPPQLSLSLSLSVQSPLKAGGEGGPQPCSVRERRLKGRSYLSWNRRLRCLSGRSHRTQTGNILFKLNFRKVG